MLYIIITYCNSFNLIFINLGYADSFFTFRNKFVYDFIIGCTNFFSVFFISYGLNSGVDSGCCTLYSSSS